MHEDTEPHIHGSNSNHENHDDHADFPCHLTDHGIDCKVKLGYKNGTYQEFNRHQTGGNETAAKQAIK